METWLLTLAVLLVSLLYPRILGDLPSLALMLPVLGYALWFYVAWQLPGISAVLGSGIGGIGAGLLLFAAGLPLSADAPKRYLKNSLAGLRHLRLNGDVPGTLLYQALFILYEELIWRVFLVSALLPYLPLWLIIPIAATLFWFVHEENRQFGGHSAEFLIFSLVLTTIYAYTSSLFVVWLVHATRNLLIMSNQWHNAPQPTDGALMEEKDRA